jgi:hypothetical protein
MKNRKDLNDENVKDISPDSLIAITIAEGGAMGDPGAIELVNKDLEIYYTHFGEIKKDNLECAIPFLETLGIGLGEVDGLPKEWDYLYTGFGNYLFILPEYKEKVLEYIQENYKDTGTSVTIELYSHWYEALENIIKNMEK